MKIEDGKISFEIDTNKDGEAAVAGSLNLTEAIQEAVARGEAVEGVKVVDFKFELTKLKLKLDSDKDGQELMELVIDLGEVFDEITNRK